MRFRFHYIGDGIQVSHVQSLSVVFEELVERIVNVYVRERCKYMAAKQAKK